MLFVQTPETRFQGKQQIAWNGSTAQGPNTQQVKESMHSRSKSHTSYKGHDLKFQKVAATVIGKRPN